MFKKIVFFICLAAAASAQNFTLQGGNFQVAGVPVSNGSIVLTISNPAATVCLTGVTDPTPTYTINLDANGNMPLTQVLGNTALCPQGTFYTQQLFTAANGGGTLISTSVYIVGPSAPYAGTLYPNVMVLPPVSFVGGVVLPSSTVTFSATPTFNASTVSKFYITLTGNVTSSSLTGAVKDQLIVFAISQDGIGGHTFAWPSNVKGQAISTGIGLQSTQAFTYDGTNAWPIGPLTVSSGNVDVNANKITATGPISTAGQITSTLATGTAPFSVASSTLVPNLNVSNVDGVSYPASPSTHQLPIVTAANTTTYKTVPDCQDATGNHINFTQSTDAFTCGTSAKFTGNLNLELISKIPQ